ncbi:unnamed protein product, partial [Ixodes pacificus]
GTYQGQWLRGTRHGYGVRSSAPFGLAAHNRNPGPGGKTEVRTSQTSLDSSSHPVDPASERDRKIDDCRGGFVLKARSDEPPQRRRSLVEKSSNFKKSILQGLRIKKQHSTGDIDKRGVSSGSSLRSSGSNMSSASSESAQSGLTEAHTDSNASFVSQEDTTDQNVMETYMGEWKNDRRSGYGIAERSDGLKYEGEWYNNKKYGYGVTSFKDGTREEGKYKNNVLVTSGKKKHLFLLRSAKFRERVEAAVAAAVRASQIALQKADIAISRTATARGKAEQADVAALHAKDDAEVARGVSKQFAPELYTPGTNSKGQRPPRFSACACSRPLADSTNNCWISAMKGKYDTFLAIADLHLHDSIRQTRQIHPWHIPQSRTNFGRQRIKHALPELLNHIASLGIDVMSSSAKSLEREEINEQMSLIYVKKSRGLNTEPWGTPEVRLRVSTGGATPQRRRSLFQPTRTQELTAPQLDAAQQQLLNALTKAQHNPPGSRQGTPPVTQANAKPPGPFHPPQFGQSAPQHQTPQHQQPQHQQPQPQQRAQAEEEAMPQVPGAPEPPPRTPHGSLHGRPQQREGYSFQQAMNDHFEQYRRERPSSRPPSRPPSRTPPHKTEQQLPPLTSIYGGGADCTPDSGVSESMDGDSSPTRVPQAGRRSTLPNVLPDEGSVQRTASLYVAAPRRRDRLAAPAQDTLTRKKSLPNIADAAAATPAFMSREEVSVLSSQRRDELRRMQEQAIRLRTNPLLYLFNSDVK